MSNSIERDQNNHSVNTKDTSITGTLFIVATPIGNLEDMTPRAIRTLSEVDTILAEDTRHSAPLLRHYGIGTKTYAFHEHNETKQAAKIIEMLLEGKSFALISDAGTPLISDPGYGLVHAAKQTGIRVEPIPGVCAIITALSAAGLPTDQFYFAGFIPAKNQQRKNFLKQFIDQTCTLIFYESSHRIEQSLGACVDVFGDRSATIARELTKKFETIKTAPLNELLAFVANDANQQKGEFVLIISGKTKDEKDDNSELKRTLKILLQSLPVSQAVDLVTQIYDVKKNPTYKLAISLSQEEHD